MDVSLSLLLEQVAKDKGIDKSVLTETLEQAILMAAKKTFGQNRDLETQWHEPTGSVRIFQKMTVVQGVTDAEREFSLDTAEQLNPDAEVGDEYNFEIFYRDEDEKKAKEQDKRFAKFLGLTTYKKGFGRIAAQTAKQVIIQRVREAERDNIYNQYKDRKDELVTGIVRRFERGNIIVDLGNTEAVLPVKEQAPRESYRAGDRIVAYMKDVDRGAKGQLVILSRTNVGLLRKLFEMEVPEIYEGIVRIEHAAREPGGRAKIAVSSRDSDVDPVGACVGMRGSRVQAVVQELRGEKIDIVPWSPDPARFVCNAIQPADVSRVVIDEENHTMELIVPADQLSLAIGKRGQNVRLAAQLVGWRIDIISEEKVREMEGEARSSLAEIPGLSDYIQDSLFRYGFHSAWEVVTASDETLCEVPGFTPEMAEKIRAQSRETAEVQQRQSVEDSARATCDALLDRGLLDDRSRLLLVKGLGDKTVQQLSRAGVNTVEDLLAEGAEVRLAEQTPLSVKKVNKLRHNAEIFLAGEKAGIKMAGATSMLEGLGRFLRLIGTSPEPEESAEPAEGEVAAPTEGEAATQTEGEAAAPAPAAEGDGAQASDA